MASSRRTEAVELRAVGQLINQGTAIAEIVDILAACRNSTAELFRARADYTADPRTLGDIDGDGMHDLIVNRRGGKIPRRCTAMLTLLRSLYQVRGQCGHTEPESEYNGGYQS